MNIPTQLLPEDRDQLSEFLNIGISHAGTTLSEMVGRRVTINVPVVALKSAETASQFIDKPSDVIVAVLLKISGDLEGYVFLLFPHDAALHLLHSLSGKVVGDLRALDKFDHSLFQEVGNVLTGGMLQGLSRFLKLQLLHSVPDVVVDMSGALLNTLTASMIARHEKFFSLDVAICVDAEHDAFVCKDGEQTRGRMFLFLGPEAVARILEITNKINAS
jgi:chemotaxis protein CheC